MARLITGIIGRATGAPREGMQVDFVPAAGATVSVLTDAAGAFRAELEPGRYTLALPDAARLNGSPYPYSAGTVFAVTVPDGAGPVAMLEITRGGTVGLLDLIAGLTSRVEALESPSAAGPGV